ncbi:hypothetical protein J3F83DRAFT_744657 [Trichoderma novae-zelandiae]
MLAAVLTMLSYWRHHSSCSLKLQVCREHDGPRLKRTRQVFVPAPQSQKQLVRLVNRHLRALRVGCRGKVMHDESELRFRVKDVAKVRWRKGLGQRILEPNLTIGHQVVQEVVLLKCRREDVLATQEHAQQLSHQHIVAANRRPPRYLGGTQARINDLGRMERLQIDALISLPAITTTALSSRLPVLRIQRRRAVDGVLKQLKRTFVFCLRHALQAAGTMFCLEDGGGAAEREPRSPEAVGRVPATHGAAAWLFHERIDQAFGC